MITKLRKRVLEVYGPKNQKVLARDAGLTPAVLSRYCTGLQPISAKHLFTLCELLRCEPHDITGFVEMSNVHAS